MKWTEKNAAALALVDRLPIEAQERLSIISDNKVLVHDASAHHAISKFVAEFAPDSEVKRGPPESWGEQRMRVTFADGVKLLWNRRVRVTVTTDEE